MNRTLVLFIPVLLCLSQVAAGSSPVAWEKGIPIPDEHGFAGPFAGVSSGTLVVAGGANFPDSYPWEGGRKVWHDRIFLLPEGSKEWTVSSLKLPRALAYGVSVSLPEQNNSIVMLGGSDGQRTSPCRTSPCLRSSSSTRDRRSSCSPFLPCPSPWPNQAGWPWTTRYTSSPEDRPREPSARHSGWISGVLHSSGRNFPGRKEPGKDALGGRFA